MQSSALTIVRPRAHLPETGELLPLEDVVLAHFAAGHKLIHIVGEPGSGKTTAFAYLRDALPDAENIALFDNRQCLDPGRWLDPSLPAARATIDTRVLVSSASKTATVRLARWTQDDWIEYLLQVAPGVCASVMDRLGGCADDPLLARPETCRLVLDAMIADPRLRTAEAAIRQFIRGRTSIEQRRELHLRCRLFEVLADLGKPDLKGSRDSLSTVPRLLQFPDVRRVLGAEGWLRELRRWRSSDDVRFFSSFIPASFLQRIAKRLRDRPELQRKLNVGFWSCAPHGNVSLLELIVAVDPSWVPEFPLKQLSRAQLPSVQWPAVELEKADLRECNFRSADLSGANLQKVSLKEAQLDGAKLIAANLSKAVGSGISFTGADLSRANCEAARLAGADLSGSRLDGANFRRAVLFGVNFHGASLREVILGGANMCQAVLREADCTKAVFSGAKMKDADLREARLTGASFFESDLRDANLEAITIADAMFEGANLEDALLTNSYLPGANFYRADLPGAKLAGISWPGANLRLCDLSDVSFGMGSTRSGLLDSPIPMEGSMTGFYTDEREEQYFKPIEEIRRADLRGVDLRDAVIKNADFYLVDLRGAKYTEEQREHLARTGAILEEQG